MKRIYQTYLILLATINTPLSLTVVPTITFDDSTTKGIYYYTADPGKVGNEFQINTDTHPYNIGGIVSAEMTNGNVMVAWIDTSSSPKYVYGQVIDNSGTKIGSEFQISSSGVSSLQLQPRIAALSNGNVMVTWSISTTIYCKILDNIGSAVTGEIQLNEADAFTKGMAPVVELTNDNIMCVWIDEIYRIIGQIIDQNGTKVGSNFQISTHNAYYYHYPAITALLNGNALVAWPALNSPYPIYGQIVDNTGTKVGSEFQISTDHGGAPTYQGPALTTLTGGNVMASWCDYYSPYYPYGQMLTSNGTKVGAEIEIAAMAMGLHPGTAEAPTSNNRAMIFWITNAGGVYGQIVDADGNKVGDAIKINTNHNGWPNTAPSSVILGNNNIMISWATGPNWPPNIYGQIYNPNSTSNLGITTSGTEQCYINSDGLTIADNLSVSGTTNLHNLNYTWPAAPTAGTYLEADVVDGSNVTLAWTTPASDQRVKQNIKNIDTTKSLECIKKLRPVEFEFIPEKKKAFHIHGHTGTHAGLIAQETKDILPTIVTETTQKFEDDSSLYKIEYNELTPYLIGAIQSLSSKYKQKLSELQHELKELQSQVYKK